MRYAIYYTPPADHPLLKAATDWLGRDAYGREVATPKADEALVRDPARYGFHGTLKAPFSLAAGKSEAELFAAFDAFATDFQSFTIPEIVLGQLGPFFALVPDNGHDQQIAELADACVRKFEHFRAPLGHSDIERRNPAELPERQRRYLLDWGYPYVFEEFRFHLTLTGKVPQPEQARIREQLEKEFADFIGKPLPIEHIALFAEPERGAPFSVARLQRLKAIKSGEAA